jgi:hypothetical protein
MGVSFDIARLCGLVIRLWFTFDNPHQPHRHRSSIARVALSEWEWRVEPPFLVGSSPAALLAHFFEE